VRVEPLGRVQVNFLDGGSARRRQRRSPVARPLSTRDL